MFTIRNVGGMVLLLAGSTWLWQTAGFASRGVSTSGGLWAFTRVLCLLTVVGFCFVTWALFTRHNWREAAATASAVQGLVELFPYGVAARVGGEADRYHGVERVRARRDGGRGYRAAARCAVGAVGFPACDAGMTKVSRMPVWVTAADVCLLATTCPSANGVVRSARRSTSRPFRSHRSVARRPAARSVRSRAWLGWPVRFDGLRRGLLSRCPRLARQRPTR